MTIRTIINYLRAHGVGFVQVRDKLFARNEWTIAGRVCANYVNVTGLSRRELLTWLGY